MIAEPLYDWVYCTECCDLHEADLSSEDAHLVLTGLAEPQECIPVQHVDSYIDDTFATHNVYYGRDKKFMLQTKHPALQPCHRPIYYLEETND